MKNKHTPGKWTVHNPTKTDSRLMVLHPDGNRVVAGMNEGFKSSKGIISTKEREANAQLIAQSPAMYEYIEKQAAAGDSEARKIIAAILKAEGGE